MLEWSLRWGKHEAHLLELAEDGREIAALEDKPTLSPIQEAAYDAYWLASPGRVLGFGAVGGIPSSDVIAVARVWGLEPEWFLRVVRAMDVIYCDHVNSGRRDDPAPPKKTARKPARRR